MYLVFTCMLGESFHRQFRSLLLCLSDIFQTLILFFGWFNLPGNIYWTDRGHDVIQVAKLNGSSRFVVIHDDMEKPRSIAVHPTQGWVPNQDLTGETTLMQQTETDNNNKNYDIIISRHGA